MRCTGSVDLNFANPRVLLELIEVFLYHLTQGIQVIRLDAIAYVWKEIGHPSIHHPKTHLIVKLFRAICDRYFPWVIIITETNVPHTENISYFGAGNDEAHMIYQFSLPPLTLDAFVRGDSTYLSKWAKSIEAGSDPVTYFNFLASHDGVGVTPTHEILSETELESLIDTVKSRGGLVSYKATASGEIPYELNVNYRDAVTDPSLSDSDRAAQFVAAQAIMLTVIGVPGIYIHSILGSGNYLEGVEQTKANRTINREKLDLESVRAELRDPSSMRSLIYRNMAKLLTIRKGQKSFHPRASQRIIDIDKAIFCVVRRAIDDSQTIIGLINLTGSPQEVSFDPGDTGFDRGGPVRDLVEDAAFSWEGDNLVGTISPWQVVWMTP